MSEIGKELPPPPGVATSPGEGASRRIVGVIVTLLALAYLLAAWAGLALTWNIKADFYPYVIDEGGSGGNWYLLVIGGIVCLGFLGLAVVTNRGASRSGVACLWALVFAGITVYGAATVLAQKPPTVVCWKCTREDGCPSGYLWLRPGLVPADCPPAAQQAADDMVGLINALSVGLLAIAGLTAAVTAWVWFTPKVGKGVLAVGIALGSAVAVEGLGVMMAVAIPATP